MENMLERYDELYNSMATSKDVAKMHIFGHAERWAFEQLVSANPKFAQKWLDKLEATEWNNYLSQSEAETIVSGLVSSSGQKGPKWQFPLFETIVSKLNGRLEYEPYYNRYALWATANMLYSDHASSLSKFIHEEDMPHAIYLLAVDKLMDKDRPRFVRDYFHL